MSDQAPNELAQPSPTTALDRWFEFRIADIHTALPAAVQAFHPEDNTADVQPLVKRIFEHSDGTLEELSAPLLEHVPIQYPRGGGYYFAFPLQNGDPCFLIFAERSIDAWFATGKESVPFPLRKHDWSDAICLPGVSAQPQVLQGLNITDLVIGKVDGSQEIRLAPAGVVLKAAKIDFGDKGGPPIARVGDTVTIDPTSDPAFFLWLKTVAGSGGAPNPYTAPITARITSGSPTVGSK